MLRAGDNAQAREMHEQAMVICEGLGGRAGVAGACTGLAPAGARGLWLGSLH